jgi:hypothetical protein
MSDYLKDITTNKFIQEMEDIHLKKPDEIKSIILYCIAMLIGFIGGILVCDLPCTF